MKYILVIAWVIFFSFLSCNYQNSHDSLKGLEIEFTDNISKPGKDSLKLIYAFDGNCSACILDFIQWLKQWNNNSDNEIKCYFISSSNDVEHIEYYIDKFDVEILQNQYLIADSSRLFFDKNKLINSYPYPILLDTNNRIITSKDPFESRKIRKTYNLYGLIKNH